MYLTGTEIELVPSAVAAIAIIGGYIGIRSSGRGQFRLSRETYHRDRVTETYINLLKGVHKRNAMLHDVYTTPIDTPLRTPTMSEFDPTTEEETLFGAQLLAYASPKADDLWGKFAGLTGDFELYLRSLRRSLGVTPESIPAGPVRVQMEARFDEWKAARDALKEQIREELRDPPAG